MTEACQVRDDVRDAAGVSIRTPGTAGTVRSTVTTGSFEVKLLIAESGLTGAMKTSPSTREASFPASSCSLLCEPSETASRMFSPCADSARCTPVTIGAK